MGRLYLLQREVPRDIDLTFIDEAFEEIDFSKKPDLVAMSVMLTAQLPRAIEIAEKYREMKVPVIFGGIATMLHSEEVMLHSDSVFLGEVEGRFGEVLDDFKNNRLKRCMTTWMISLILHWSALPVGKSSTLITTPTVA